MSATTDTRELAAALRVSARAVRKRSSAERWPAQTTAGAKVYVLEEMPEECTRAVLRLRSEKAKAAAIQAATSQRSVEVSRKWREFEAAPAWRRERATERALFLDVVQRFRAAGHPVNAAIFKASELQAKAPSRSACMRWLADVKGLAREHWPAFLMPDPAPGNRRAFVHPDALVWLVDDYCRAERPTLRYRCTRAASPSGSTITPSSDGRPRRQMDAGRSSRDPSRRATNCASRSGDGVPSRSTLPGAASLARPTT